MPIDIQDAEEVEERVEKQKIKEFLGKQVKSTDKFDSHLMEILQMEDQVGPDVTKKLLIKELKKKKNYRKIHDLYTLERDKIEKKFKGNCGERPECRVEEIQDPLDFIDEKGNICVVPSKYFEPLELTSKVFDGKSLNHNSTKILVEADNATRKESSVSAMKNRAIPPTAVRIVDYLKESNETTENSRYKNNCYSSKHEASESYKSDSAWKNRKNEIKEPQENSANSLCKKNEIIPKHDHQLAYHDKNRWACESKENINYSQFIKTHNNIPNKAEIEDTRKSELPHRSDCSPQFRNIESIAPNEIQCKNHPMKINPTKCSGGNSGSADQTPQRYITPRSNTDTHAEKRIKIPKRPYDNEDLNYRSYDRNYSSRRPRQDYHDIDLPQKRPNHCDSSSSRASKKYKRSSRDDRNNRDAYSRYNDKTERYHYKDYKHSQSYDKTENSHCKDYQHNKSYDKKENSHYRDYQHNKSNDKAEYTYYKDHQRNKSYDSPPTTHRNSQHSHNNDRNKRKAEEKFDSKPTKNSFSPSNQPHGRGILGDRPNDSHDSTSKSLNANNPSKLSQKQLHLDNRSNEKQDFTVKSTNPQNLSKPPQNEALVCRNSDKYSADKPRNNYNSSTLLEVEQIIGTKLTQDLTKKGSEKHPPATHAPRVTLSNTTTEESKTGVLNSMDSNLMAQSNLKKNSSGFEKSTTCPNLVDQRKNLYKENASNANSKDLHKPEKEQFLLRDEIPNKSICHKNKDKVNSPKTLDKIEDHSSEKNLNSKGCLQSNLYTYYYSKK